MTADDHHGAVAIVDDDPAVRDSLKLLLEVAGHRVNAYATAKAFLEDREAQPSCLILDQRMPTMTGLELATRLRDEGAGIPVLLLTAELSPTIAALAGEIGIQRVLEKPAAEGDLLNFIEGCIEHLPHHDRLRAGGGPTAGCRIDQREAASVVDPVPTTSAIATVSAADIQANLLPPEPAADPGAIGPGS
jgi:DNA-binding response OmpR family regulator